MIAGDLVGLRKEKGILPEETATEGSSRRAKSNRGAQSIKEESFEEPSGERRLIGRRVHWRRPIAREERVWEKYKGCGARLPEP